MSIGTLSVHEKVLFLKTEKREERERGIETSIEVIRVKATCTKGMSRKGGCFSML